MSSDRQNINSTDDALAPDLDPKRVYECGGHHHFRPHKGKTPEYKKMKWCDDDHGAFPIGTKVYARGSSNHDEEFQIESMLNSNLYILRKDREVQQCEGKHGNQLWIADNLAKQPWWNPATGPPPPYEPAGSAAAPPGYETQ